MNIYVCMHESAAKTTIKICYTKQATFTFQNSNFP